MNIRLFMIPVVLGSLLSMSSGCTGKGPFLMVQLCLHDQKNVLLFKDTMKLLSESEGMEYGDNSAATEKELIATKLKQSYPFINIAGIRADGVGWGAGNLGLSAYEVGLGFSEGSNPEDAHRFANLVIKTLKQKWQVYTLPPGHGAFPMKSCEKGESVQ